MDRISFTIFEPDGKKFHLTPDWITFFLWIPPLLLCWLFQSNISPNDIISTLITTYFVAVGILTAYFLIASFWSYKPLNGELKGNLIFEDVTIIVNGKAFNLKDINNLDFQFSDYYGFKANRFYSSTNPMLSQGVDNYITFTDNLNQCYIIYFKLATEHNYQELSPFINAAIKAKKMEFKRGIDLMGIENISIN